MNLPSLRIYCQVSKTVEDALSMRHMSTEFHIDSLQFTFYSPTT